MKRKIYEFINSELTKDSDSFAINDFVRIERYKLGSSVESELVLSCKGVKTKREVLRCTDFDSMMWFIKYNSLIYAQEIADAIVAEL